MFQQSLPFLECEITVLDKRTEWIQWWIEPSTNLSCCPVPYWEGQELLDCIYMENVLQRYCSQYFRPVWLLTNTQSSCSCDSSTHYDKAALFSTFVYRPTGILFSMMGFLKRSSEVKMQFQNKSCGKKISTNRTKWYKTLENK